MERFLRPRYLSASESRAEQAAGADRTENIVSRSGKVSALPGNSGNQGQEASRSAFIPDRSMTRAPERIARFQLAMVNWGEPAKKIRLARLKLSSSTG